MEHFLTVWLLYKKNSLKQAGYGKVSFGASIRFGALQQDGQ